MGKWREDFLGGRKQYVQGQREDKGNVLLGDGMQGHLAGREVVERTAGC